MPISRPHPAAMRKSYAAPPPPPPPGLDVQVTGGGVQYITGPGTANFNFTISAGGGDGGPYVFNVGFGDSAPAGSVNFVLSLTVPNGGTAADFASGTAHDSSGNSGVSNSQFFTLISNPV